MRTHLFYFMFLLTGASFPLFGQETQENALKSLIENSREEVEALSLYPVNIREAILESTLHPELLVKLGAIQNKTSNSFKELIRYLPEADQKKYWQLTAHDGLIRKLAEGGQKDKKQIQQILADYPREIHATAEEFGLTRHRTLEKINTLWTEADEASEVLLQKYPEKTRSALRLLLQHPAIIYLLTQNLELVVLTGDIYASNPDLIRNKMDSIQAEVSQRHAEEVAEWKKGLEENPRALQEFEQVSGEFTGEGYEGYDPMYPDAVKPKQETEQSAGTERNVTNVYHYHYPFWFGYPAWYPSAWWYWYPYWYHYGYYRSGNAIVVIDVPSYFFVRWYFSVPWHHYRYPHFSDYVIRYYKKGPGPSRTGLSEAVREWERSSNSEVVRRLISDDTRRTERFKEYGRMEQDYERTRQRNPEQPVSRDRYFSENQKRYPNLSGEERNTIRYRENPPERTIRREVSPGRSYEINRAREYHQRTWERSEYNHRPQRTTPTPTTPTRRSGTGTKRGN